MDYPPLDSRPRKEDPVSCVGSLAWHHEVASKCSTAGSSADMADDSGAGKFVDKQKAREMRGGLGRVKGPYGECAES